MRATNRAGSRQEQGITYLTAIILLFTLSVLGTGVATFVASNQSSRMHQITSETSYYIGNGGIEYVYRRAKQDGAAPSALVGTYELAGGTFTVADAGGGMVVVTGGVGSSAAAPYTVKVTPNVLTQAACLVVNTSGAVVSGNLLQGITFQRNTGNANCNFNLVMTAFNNVTWTYPAGEIMNRIRIGGGSTEFTGSVSNGGNAPFQNNYTISDNLVHSLTDIRWDTTQVPRNYSWNILMGDGSSKAVTVNIVADNQASCLSVSHASTLVFGANHRFLGPVALSNTCSTGLIGVKRMTVSWTPLNPTVNLERIRVNGSNVWNTTVSSGTDVDVTDYTISASGSATMDDLRFDTSIAGRPVTLLFTMFDNTTKTHLLDIYEANMASCLVFNTASASISGRDLLNTSWSVNASCSKHIAINSVTVSWTPTSPTRQMQQIRVGGTNWWSGSINSGQNADMTNYFLQAGAAATSIDRFRFSATMATVSRTYTFQWTLMDGTTVTSPNFTLP
jgi:hypothetical protein